MNKRDALKTLITHSFFLSEEVKQELLIKLVSLSDEDVHTLGTFLATEKKHSLAAGGEIIKNLEELEKEL